MSVTIDHAQNGWYLVHSEEGEQDRVFVFSHDDREQSEAEAFQALLYAVLDICGPSSSRYSEHRVYIRVEPGDKHSSHPDNQENEDESNP
mgnify:CR=1 FL=1